MRFPKIHNFLKWSVPALTGTALASLAVFAALAQAYPKLNKWGADFFNYWWPIVTAPWFILLAVLLICGYIAALVHTGGEPKHKPASIIDPEGGTEQKMTIWDRIRRLPPSPESGTLMGDLHKGKLEHDLENIRKAEQETAEAETADAAWDDVTTDRVPFVRIRHIASEFGLDFSSNNSSASNAAYRLEGVLRQAVIDEKLKVWGKKYKGPVKSNDPVVPIDASHFEDYEFGHGQLHYETANDQSHTGLLAKRLEELVDQVYYDLQLSYADLRAVMKEFSAKENNSNDALKAISKEDEKHKLARRIAAAPDTSEFDYPSLVAILRAEIDKEHGLIQAEAGRPPHTVSVLMRISNRHGKPMNDCMVQLFSISEQRGLTTSAHQLFTWGGKTQFQTNPNQTHNFYFVKRDMTDPITPKPFVLLLADSEKPLHENTNYLLTLKLISPYPIATIVEIEVKTGEGVDISCVIKRQYLEGYEE